MGRLKRLLAFVRWLRGSLWFLPALMTLVAIALAFLTIALDLRIPANVRADWWFVFGVGPEGVRGVLSALAGSIITVAGVVFSITVVALQLASTQYSPSVLRTFLEDRATHAVLGVFIATFLYALLVLRTVGGETQGVGGFVPSLSVTVAMALGLLSMAALIFFIHHIAQSIRAAVIVSRLTDEAREIARRAFPREFGAPAHERPAAVEARATPDVRWLVTADEPGYLSSVEESVLFAGGDVTPFTVRMMVCIGDFLRTGDAIAEVCTSAERDREKIDSLVRHACPLAVEPSGRQDIAVAVSRLTDVAVRALSSALNDATTASTCLDALSEVFAILGRRLPADDVRVSRDGRIHLVARHPSFDELVALAFSPIRHHGSADPKIALKLLDVALALGARVHESRRAVFVREAELTWRAAAQSIVNDDQRLLVRRHAEVVLASLVDQADGPVARRAG